MEKVKTFLADISDLLNEKNYQKIYEKVPAFRQEKADRLKHREETQDTARCRAVL